jgi:hypothetical protein
MPRPGLRAILRGGGTWSPRRTKELDMIILGLVLVILGALLNISILYTIGAILLVVGAVLWILGATGRAVGGRAHYW